jgi:transposase InsO family protein
MAGRPVKSIWIVAAIDVASGWCLGYSMTLGAVWRADILRALGNMIRPKPSFAHLHVTGQWLAYGLPHLVKLDRGKANMAKDVISALDELGIEWSYGKKAEPKERPYIERFFRTLGSQFISGLPGYLGRNTRERPEAVADPQELEALEDVENAFIKYLVDKFAINKPRTRSMSPAAYWLDYRMKHPDWSPDLPSSNEMLDDALRIRATPKATHEGLRWNHLFYNSADVLRVRSVAHAHRGNPKVEIRINAEDISDAKMRDPGSGAWVGVPCLYRAYAPGVTFRQHMIVSAAANTMAKADKGITEDMLLETKLAITRRASQKLRRRSANMGTATDAGRFGDYKEHGGASPFGGVSDRQLTAAEFDRAVHRGRGTRIPSDPRFDPDAARRRLARRAEGESSGSERPTDA